MAVRQMTGSVRLLRILHGLGHTASTDTVYKHDTALAIISSDEAGKEISIPRSINPDVFTTIIWDNNDFNEETVSGKGTTHVANGIIVQNENDGQTLGTKLVVSKKNRSIVAPETTILPYTSKEKGNISLRDESSEIPLEEKCYRHVQEMGRNADFLYLLSKMNASESGKLMPGWTGFNTQVHKVNRSVSRIAYLPVIDAPVTDMATVNTLLRHSVSICQRLQIPQIVLVFDEAIYAKAQMIRWKDDELKERLVIRLGDFHTVMSFCSGISKIFKDAGLQDIMIESEVVAPGSLKGVLTGKHYNRSIRAHKIIFEAMERLRLQAFEKSLTTTEKVLLESINRIMEDDPERDNFLDISSGNNVTEAKMMYDLFVQKRCEENPLFSFWSHYIEMVQLLLLYIRATRTTDWSLHLSSLKSMIPWFFATDRVNYSRYASCYWLEMMCLEITHPYVAVNISQNWTVQRQENYSFSSIACDQTIEQTLNRDSKMKGGLIGKTLNRGAVHRWLMGQAERSAITRQCEAMANISEVARSRKDLDRTRMAADDKAVMEVIKTVESMINPFDNDKDELVHLASGSVATAAIAEDMKRMLEKGKFAADDFMKSKIVGEMPNIYESIKKTKLETFSSLGKKVVSKNKKGELVAMKNSKILFTKMLLIAKSRNLQMDNVLKYSLRPFPASLATHEGDIVKTSKAKLLHAVEEQVEEATVSELPITEKVCVLDAMAMLQTLTPIPETFGELATQLLVKVVNSAVYSNCKRVDFVCDRYPRESIKNLERNRRAAGGVQVVRIYSEQQKVPRQWKNLCHVVKTKKN
ncbi:uncharacterized protein LOC114534480 [Dendronephthya gigantea]|uniref:uncharacterized protein LOC114534480 n=1 Tax=Dendronephthya gigantea TaxID=151771 RepID=UPI00106CCF42|nr:uncharacterized protein LOC114534480 [Dendronephthya gigantea]